MAKKPEKSEENIEREEKQEPQKVKKQGGLNLPLLAGIIGGVIIIQAVLIIVIFQLFVSPIYQQLPLANKQETQKEELSEEQEEAEKEAKVLSAEDEKNLIFIETGRITTNPLASPRFVVINLGLELLAKEPEIKKELSQEIEKSLLGKKIMAGTQENINNLIGSLTAEEISNIKRDTLKSMIVEKLKPFFKQNKIRLYDVKLKEFIIQ